MDEEREEDVGKEADEVGEGHEKQHQGRLVPLLLTLTPTGSTGSILAVDGRFQLADLSKYAQITDEDQHGG